MCLFLTYTVGWMWVGNVFFFVKQKTAYEMRISDWSSDVCSSDLSAQTGEAAGVGGPQHRGRCRWWLHRHRGRHRDARTAERHLRADGEEIGRASCRERVCQYV